MERRKNNRTREAVEEALQRRDIDDLKNVVKEGFRGIHERQDVTNGKVRKIIIALVLVVGVVIGLTGKESVPLLIKLLA